jgi:hypothetical protein
MTASWAQEAPPPAQQPAPPAPAAPSPAAAPMVKEAKVVIDDKATSNGEIVITFTAQGGAAMPLRVSVLKGMHGKDVADDLLKEMTIALGAAYKVGQDGGAVTVKGKDKQMFSIAVNSQTANGLSVRVK